MKRSKPKGFGGHQYQGGKAKQWHEIVSALQLGGEFKSVRPVGGVYAFGMHSIKILTAKGEFNIKKVALNFDPDTGEFDPSIEDPYANLPNLEYSTVEYYTNVIDRDEQDMAPPKRKRKVSRAEAKSLLKEEGSTSWTPVRVLRCPAGFARKISESVGALNKHRVKGRMETFDLADPRYGSDIYVKFDKQASSPGDMYQAQKGDGNKLVGEELKYLLFDLDGLRTPEPIDIAIREAAGLGAKAPDAPDLEEDDEDEDDSINTRRKKRKTKSRKRGTRKKKPVRKTRKTRKARRSRR